MTWVAITEDTVLDGTEADEPGAVMLNLMRSQPSVVADDMMSWILMRDSRMEKVVIAFTTDPSMADRLKEDYLDYVATYAADTGYYTLIYGNIEIREVVEDAES